MLKKFFFSIVAFFRWIYTHLIRGKKKWIALILVCIGAGYYFFGPKGEVAPPAPDPTTKVTRWDIESSIEVLWKSKLVHEQKLRFNQEGRVSEVFFKEGDRVSANQALAKLDTNVADNDIKQGILRVTTAKNNLAKLYNKDVVTEKLKAKNQIKTTEQQLETAQVEYKNLGLDGAQKLQQAQDNFQQALKDLKNKKQDANTSSDELQQDLVNKEKELVLKQANFEASTKTLAQSKARDDHDLQAQLSTRQKEIDSVWYGFSADASDVTSQLDSINSIISVETTRTPRYPEFTSTYFSARNTDYKSQVSNAYWNTKHELEVYKKNLQTQSETVENIISMIAQNQKIYASLQNAANATYLGLENSIESESVSSDTISGLKSSMSSMRDAATSKIQAAKTSLATIQSLDTVEMITNKHNQELTKRDQDYDAEKNTLEQLQKEVSQIKAKLGIKETDLTLGVDKLSTALEQAQLDLERTARENQLSLMTKTQSITSLEQQLQEEKQALIDLDKAPTTEEADNAKNEVKSAEIALEQAQEKLNTYTLKAPFAGVVRKSDIKVGDNLTTNTESYVYIENPDLVEVTASLDQVDVVKVAKGQTAIVHFDAFPDLTFSGQLSDIDSSPKDANGGGNGGNGGSTSGMAYDVHILIDRQKKSIYSWMTASVKVVTDSVTNVLIVPTTAVLKENNEAKVNKTVKGKKVPTVVTVGISDGSQTQIMSGLKEGEEIYEINFSDNGVNIPDGSSPDGAGGPSVSAG